MMAAELIRQRAADWQRRSDKWHGILDRERAWERRGATWPMLVGAVAALIVMMLSSRFGPQVAVLSGLACALVGWRASTARQKLSASQADKVWVSADRLAEQYKSLVALLDDRDNRIDVLALLEASDMLENTSRFGVPDDTQQALVAARKHLSANTVPKAELICAP